MFEWNSTIFEVDTKGKKYAINVYSDLWGDAYTIIKPGHKVSLYKFNNNLVHFFAKFLRQVDFSLQFPTWFYFLLLHCINKQ